MKDVDRDAEPPVETPASKGRESLNAGLMIVGGALAIALGFGLFSGDEQPARSSGSASPYQATATSNSDGAPTSATNAVAEEATALMSAYVSASTACNQIARTAMKRLGGDDPIVAYEAAKEAEEYCTQAASKVGALDPPPSSGEATEEKFKAVLDTCRTAHWQKARGLGKLAKVIDGRQSPSFMIEPRDQLELGEDGLELCRSQFAEAVTAVGGRPEDLSGYQ